MPRHFHMLLNARSGTALNTGVTPDALTEVFVAAGHSVTVDADQHLPMARRLARLRRSNAEVVIAAGGDGTVTAVAEVIVDTHKSLAILPLGTVNALARDLGVPLDLKQWIAALDTMEPRSIDVGEVNGRIFLHKVVAGFVPGLAVGREQIRGRTEIGAKIGFLRFFLRRLFRSRRIAVEIAGLDGGKQVRRVVAIAVANNAYDEGLGRVFSRTEFDRGTLTLYLLKHLGFADVVRLTAEMLLGNWQKDEALEIEAVSSLTIRSSKKMLKVMLDGEVQGLSVPLSFRIRPGALSILAPVRTEAPIPSPTPALVEA
jgi:diacylglycerol kinase family enzyme